MRTRWLAAGWLTVCAVAGAPPAVAAPVLRAAAVHVEQRSPTSCRVDASFTIEGAVEVEHRVEVLDGAVVSVPELSGAVSAGGPRAIGRTRALTLRPSTASYRLRYEVAQPDSGRFRCPLWLPTTPADGRSRAVTVTVDLPAHAEPSGTMPAFAWSGSTGTATLGHVPAFVRVPYAAPGVTPPWNLPRLMDAASLGVLVLASLAWWRRGRG